MKILIVGGGSAGWITAAILNRKLGRHAEISLIESDTIGRIGVGEATIPSMKDTLLSIGVPEREFLKEASATFKHGIRFVDWESHGKFYYHPFDGGAGHQDSVGLHYLMSDGNVPFADCVSTQPQLSDLGFAPKNEKHEDFKGLAQYAYHMDAERFAVYLRDLAKSRGVKHIVDDVTHADVGPDGNITGVNTASGRRLTAGLYIDCSGFARVLISKALGVKFEDYSQWLLCDSAAAMRVPYDVKSFDNIKPYTTSTALSSGWVWDIGLHDRRGVGYVFSSQFISDEDAIAELKQFEGPHAKDLDVRILKFRTGRVQETWRNNCVAIGLAGGFIEPLESTGLALVELGVNYLIECLPRIRGMTRSAEVYNRAMRHHYQECLDFINLHYCLTKRRDTPFWREVSKPSRISPSLADNLQLWEEKPPSRLDSYLRPSIWGHVNYEYILYGMGWRPRYLNPKRIQKINRAAILERVRATQSALRLHSKYLESIGAISQTGEEADPDKPQMASELPPRSDVGTSSG